MGINGSLVLKLNIGKFIYSIVSTFRLQLLLMIEELL